MGKSHISLYDKLVHNKERWKLKVYKLSIIGVYIWKSALINFFLWRLKFWSMRINVVYDGVEEGAVF